MADVADLADARIKFDRAEEHLRSLKAKTIEWGKPYTEAQPIYFGRDGEWHTVNSVPGPAPNPVLAAIAGDFINNLRCVLDYLVWQAVLREGEQPDQRHSFPIHEREEEWVAKVQLSYRKRQKSPLFGIPVDGDAWTVIKEAQPYKRSPTNPFTDPLAVLQRLSNADKHRALPPQFTFPSLVSLLSVIGWSDEVSLVQQRYVARPLSLEAPTELIALRFAPPETDPGMHMKGKLGLNPTFGEQGIKARSGPIPGRKLVYGTQASIFGGTDEMVRVVREVVEALAALPNVTGWSS
ncbi:MAG: hypothetical protein ABI473_07550 [Candidatus Dormibacter sp.]